MPIYKVTKDYSYRKYCYIEAPDATSAMLATTTRPVQWTDEDEPDLMDIDVEEATQEEADHEGLPVY